MASVRLGFVMLVCFLFVACDVEVTSDLADAPAIDVAAEAEVIKALESQWSGYYGTADIAGITKLLAEDTVLIAPGAMPLRGLEEVRDATLVALSDDSVSVSWESTEARVAPSGEMAFDYGVATTVFTDGSRAEAPYLVVWVKEDGAWKVAADMFH